MLNPYLERRLFALPIQPILVEADVAKFTEVLGQILGLNLITTGKIPSFVDVFRIFEERLHLITRGRWSIDHNPV